MSKVYLILSIIILSTNSFELDSLQAVTSNNLQSDITESQNKSTQLEPVNSQAQKRLNPRNFPRLIVGLSAMLMAYISCRALIDFSNNGHDLESHNKIFLIPYFCISGVTYFAIGCDQLYKIWQNQKQDINIPKE